MYHFLVILIIIRIVTQNVFYGIGKHAVWNNYIKFLYGLNASNSPYAISLNLFFFSLQLSGNVHLNPGPEVETIGIGHLNVRSLVRHKVPGPFIPGCQFTNIEVIRKQQVNNLNTSIYNTLSQKRG